MLSPKFAMVLYAFYWIFLLVIVVNLEKKIKGLEQENSELKKRIKSWKIVEKMDGEERKNL